MTKRNSVCVAAVCGSIEKKDETCAFAILRLRQNILMGMQKKQGDEGVRAREVINIKVTV